MIRMPSAIFATVLLGSLPAQSWLPTSIEPSWASNGPVRTIRFEHRSLETDEQNGARLAIAMAALQPGEGLAVPPGRYSIRTKVDLIQQASASRPIWIYGTNLDNKPVITRPDANQNVLNIGERQAARYLCLRGLEITGGGDLVRMVDGHDIWIDRCYIHDGGGLGIAAQGKDMERLFITRNEIARPGPGTNGEAIYLGGNYAKLIVSYSVIAQNRIHDTKASIQGDGIEIKQGSHHNWIVANTVWSTRYPCVLVYGTAGNGENVIERNVMWDSDDAVLQVQGDAIVRNNLAIDGKTAGFSSHPHQGPVQNLLFAHNTLINEGRGAGLSSWGGQPNLRFVNNAVYSRNSHSIYFGQQSTGVTISGNVIFGPTQWVAGGTTRGSGLTDFVGVSWNASQRDATPVAGGPLDSRGSAAFATRLDITGSPRSFPVDAGATESAPTLTANLDTIRATAGGRQQLSFRAPQLPGQTYLVLGSYASSRPAFGFGAFDLPLQADTWLAYTANRANSTVLQSTLGRLDAQGRANAAIQLPALPPSTVGLRFDHCVTVWGPNDLQYVSNRQGLALR